MYIGFNQWAQFAPEKPGKLDAYTTLATTGWSRVTRWLTHSIVVPSNVGGGAEFKIGLRSTYFRQKVARATVALTTSSCDNFRWKEVFRIVIYIICPWKNFEKLSRTTRNGMGITRNTVFMTSNNYFFMDK